MAEATAAPPQVESGAIADGVERRLDPRAVDLERAAGWIATGVTSFGLLVGLAILLIQASLPRWSTVPFAVAWCAATLALGLGLHRWAEIAHRHISYRVDGQGIEIRKGVFWRAVISVPRSRVQHTDVSQGPLERGYGLGTLVVYTAGTDYARVELPGLDHATALRIRDHLLPREGDDAV